MRFEYLEKPNPKNKKNKKTTVFDNGELLKTPVIKSFRLQILLLSGKTYIPVVKYTEIAP